MLFPCLASVRSAPGLARRGRQLSVLMVGELDRRDIVGEAGAVGGRPDARPLLAGVGRIVKQTSRTSRPDVSTDSGDRAEDLVIDNHVLPSLTGIDGTLERAAGGDRPTWKRRRRLEDNATDDLISGLSSGSQTVHGFRRQPRVIDFGQ